MYGKALEIKAMKAWKIPKGKEGKREKICDSGEYFGQLKKDGNWYTFEKDTDGNCFLFSRKVSDVTGHLVEKIENVPHIKAALDALPNGTIVVGEIYYPGMTSNEVRTVMGCAPDKAAERQKEKGAIHYYLFDILQYDGELLLDMPCWDRVERLAEIILKHELWTWQFIEYATPAVENLDEFITDALNNGEEGAVLKRLDGTYSPNKKPAWEWVKFKREDAADVICVGFEPPAKEYSGSELETWEYWEETLTGKIYIGFGGSVKTPMIPVTKAYAKGWIGSIIIGAVNGDSISIIGTVSSGLKDSDLDEISANKEAFLTHPLAVRYMQTFDGALRHPVFAGWRDDINIEDCTWEKIFKEN